VLPLLRWARQPQRLLLQREFLLQRELLWLRR
jgi:hypothetical protein